jgi:hypothetical protein
MKLLDRLLGRSPRPEPTDAEATVEGIDAAASDTEPEALLAEPPLRTLTMGGDPPYPRSGLIDGAPPVRLGPLLDELDALLAALAGDRPDADVVCARLADKCRDMDLAPADPGELRDLTRALDEGGWRRLWLLTVAASHDALGPSLPAIAAARGARELVHAGFVGVAAGTPLLTIDLLRQSSLRLEELARRWLAALGAGVEGESAEESRAALERLDYGRLLAEVERAKLSAEERAAYLKKLQEAHDAALPQRGKW